MKKILFVCLVAVMGLGIGSAAAKGAKKASTVTTVFKTDIDCEHCAKRIMDNMPFEKGVKDVTVDVPSKMVTVVYDGSKNSAEGLIKGFSKIRVKAEVSNGCTKACCKDCSKAGTCDKKCCADHKHKEGCTEKCCADHKHKEGCTEKCCADHKHKECCAEKCETPAAAAVKK